MPREVITCIWRQRVPRLEIQAAVNDCVSAAAGSKYKSLRAAVVAVLLMMRSVPDRAVERTAVR